MAGEMMVRPKKDIKRQSYSVRLNPELIRQLKHVAVDEGKTVSQLIEDGITEQLAPPSRKSK